MEGLSELASHAWSVSGACDQDISMKPVIVALTALGLAALAPPALHAQVTITPTAGQTPEQTAADRSACEMQAAAQTGYDPS